MSNTTIIKPGEDSLVGEVREFWDYRELLYFFVWREIKVRYKQTFFGVGWAILQPFLTMIVFTIFFGKIAKIPSEGIPYPIFSYSALLLWTFFTTAVTFSGNSLVGSAHLITKVFFPRLIIPFSSALSAIVDYLIAMIILVAMMFYYGIFPSKTIIYLPIIWFLGFLCSIGFGLWLSSLNVKYRDIRFIIPFFIQLLLFATPVIYPTSILPENISWLLNLNPISPVIDAHRAALLGYKAIDWGTLALSGALSSLIFVTGLIYFRKTERFFADII